MTAWMSVRKYAQGLLMAATALLASTQAQAYTVNLAPAAQTAALGSMVAIEVSVSDLGPLGLGSYNFDLGFDAAMLGFDHVVDSFGLGLSFGADVTVGAGALTISDFSIDDPLALLVRQAGEITLFTMYFNALAVGTSELSIASGLLSDVNGDIVSFLTNAATVTVPEDTGTPVSAPGTPALLLAACVAAGLVRRRSAAAHPRG